MCGFEHLGRLNLEGGIMFKNARAFSSYSVDDLEKAKSFYSETLGLEVKQSPEGLALQASGVSIFLYPKPDHQPASFTVLNFKVKDIDKAVADLKARGVTLESYGGEIKTDEKGIFRGAATAGKGPNIAWFKDPAGNILSVVEEG